MSDNMNIQDEMTCYTVYVAGWATEHKVWATSQELALEMAERDFAHLYSVHEIGVG